MGIHSDLVLAQSDPRPMYLQIVEQIRQRIASGDWGAGEEVPSIRQLAVALRVSVITIKRSYLELERAGLIVTRQGKGSTVADRAPVGLPLKGRSWDEQLDEHIGAAASLGALLGLSPGDLAERLRRAAEDADDFPELAGSSDIDRPKEGP